MKQFLIFSVILATALSSPLAKKEQDTPAYTVVNTWEVDDTKVSIKSRVDMNFLNLTIFHKLYSLKKESMKVRKFGSALSKLLTKTIPDPECS